MSGGNARKSPSSVSQAVRPDLRHPLQRHLSFSGSNQSSVWPMRSLLQMLVLDSVWAVIGAVDVVEETSPFRQDMTQNHSGVIGGRKVYTTVTDAKSRPQVKTTDAKSRSWGCWRWRIWT